MNDKPKSVPNRIPIFIVAATLGLGVAIWVSRMIKIGDGPTLLGPEVEVVGASRALKAGDEITDDAIFMRVVSKKDCPNHALAWRMRHVVLGQRVGMDVSERDYILPEHLEVRERLAIPKGQWAVSFSVPASGIVRMLQPGDEIAIMGSLDLPKVVASGVDFEQGKTVHEDSTITLIPKVRILRVGGANQIRGDLPANEIVVALPPQEAQFLVAARRKAHLSVALRGEGDQSWEDGPSIGKVDDAVFQELAVRTKSLNLLEISKVN